MRPTDLRGILRYVPQFREKTFVIAPDPARLIAYDLGFHDLATAVAANNANVGAGYIERNGAQYLIRAPGQVTGIDDLRNVVVAQRGGIAIRLEQVADVQVGHELRNGAATQDGAEVVLGTVFMLVGENSRTVAKAAAEKLVSIAPTLPAGIRAEAIYDRTSLVDATIATVTKNLAEGALLVIAVPCCRDS